MNNSQLLAMENNSVKVKDTEYFLKRDYDICRCKEIIIASERDGKEKFRIEIDDCHLRSLDGFALIELIKKHIISQLFEC